MNQLDVEDALSGAGWNTATIAKFLCWHKANIKIWLLFERFALQAIKSGAKLGAKAIAERIRWESEVKQQEEYKVNNNYVSGYAVIFMIKHPEHAGYFETREKRGLEE